MSCSLSGEIRLVHVAQVIDNVRQCRPNGKMSDFRHWTFPEVPGQVDWGAAVSVAGLMDEVDRLLGCWAPPCSYPLYLILILVGKSTLPKSETSGGAEGACWGLVEAQVGSEIGGAHILESLQGQAEDCEFEPTVNEYGFRDFRGQPQCWNLKL